MNETTPAALLRRRIFAILIFAIGSALAVQTGLALAWAKTQPALAVRISPGNGIALNWLSEFEMLNSKSDADVSAVLGTAKRAAARAPLEAEAIRNAGFAIAARGDETKADQVIGLAAKVSKRDYFAHAWLLDRKFRLNRIDGAVEEADIVLRQRGSSWPVILPELARISSDPQVMDPLARKLAEMPYWRGSFLVSLGLTTNDIPSAKLLFFKIKALGTPASTAEMQTLFDRFDGSTDARAWYSTWLGLLPKPLPARDTQIRDGDFEGLDAPNPFNWRLFPKDGTYAEFSKNPQGSGRSLFLSFEGTKTTDFAVQSLILSPGVHKISLKLFSDDPIEKGKMWLSLSCGNYANRQSIAKMTLVPLPGRWASQQMTATVPANCPGQMLWFNGEQGRALIPAEMWVDDVQVTGSATSSNVTPQTLTTTAAPKVAQKPELKVAPKSEPTSVTEKATKSPPSPDKTIATKTATGKAAMKKPEQDATRVDKAAQPKVAPKKPSGEKPVVKGKPVTEKAKVRPSKVNQPVTSPNPDASRNSSASLRDKP